MLKPVQSVGLKIYAIRVRLMMIFKSKINVLNDVHILTILACMH